jgi:hypothetical protein
MGRAAFDILLFTEQMGQEPHEYIAVFSHRTEPLNRQQITDTKFLKGSVRENFFQKVFPRVKKISKTS